MAWNVEFTPEFRDWMLGLEKGHQATVLNHIRELERRGPHLPRPYTGEIEGSKHSHMRELRIQSKGNPLRVLYAFDPRRTAILLMGGDKTGDKRFYDRMIPLADRLYDEHLQRLKEQKK
jgi:hypothetical protein